MTLYVPVAYHTFETLKEQGTIKNPTGADTFTGYTLKPSKVYAAKVSDFADKEGVILTLEVPDGECISQAPTETMRKAHGDKVEIKELHLADVRRFELFGNEQIVSGSWRFICRRSPARFFLDKLDAMSDEERLEGRYPAIVILEAGDLMFMKSKMKPERINEYEAANLVRVIRAFLATDAGEGTKRWLGIPPYGEGIIPAERICNDLCRNYFKRQAKASSEEDWQAAGELLNVLEISDRTPKEVPYKGNLRISLSSVLADPDADDINYYTADVNAKKSYSRDIKSVLEGALYTLRTREDEIESRAKGDENGDAGDVTPQDDDPSIIMKISYQGEVLYSVMRYRGNFVIVNDEATSEEVKDAFAEADAAESEGRA